MRLSVIVFCMVSIGAFISIARAQGEDVRLAELHIVSLAVLCGPVVFYVLFPLLIHHKMLGTALSPVESATQAVAVATLTIAAVSKEHFILRDRVGLARLALDSILALALLGIICVAWIALINIF